MFKRFLVILVLALLVLVGFVLTRPSNIQKLVSPIKGVSRLKLADNLWFPKGVPKVLGAEKPPEISAKGALFVETQTGEVLYEKNSHDKLPIASLTKIMTMIVTLENRKFDDMIDISRQAADMEPDKMLLIAGERLRVEELLDGIFLVSANDAAEALAEEVTGSRDEFIRLMNSEAKQLGMRDSLFINPTGLEEDGKEQYSSAFDVALMARYAIKHWSKLVDISSNPHIYLPPTSTHQDYDLYSGINLLTTYPGVVGFKTGYTPEAGLTLVTLARKGDKEVLGVILGSDDRRGEAKELLDYSFKQLDM